ncbi:unnamed protein product [Microthlaspi erraticum]|uniref:Uncharacterized protein n=1 Tax=Microthlaspi erraticum TaxID=1685480 RepID=A0A6D2I0S4_9BRAS|nr:unnamed protein product [Microthlaspi erraticum]
MSPRSKDVPGRALVTWTNKGESRQNGAKGARSSPYEIDRTCTPIQLDRPVNLPSSIDTYTGGDSIDPMQGSSIDPMRHASIDLTVRSLHRDDITAVRSTWCKPSIEPQRTGLNRSRPRSYLDLSLAIV